MLTQNEESEEKILKLELKDISQVTLEKLITFIYTDFIDDILIDSHLFIASGKYKVGHLSLKCETKLCEKLNVSNVADLYRLAYLHEASR